MTLSLVTGDFCADLRFESVNVNTSEILIACRCSFHLQESLNKYNVFFLSIDVLLFCIVFAWSQLVAHYQDYADIDHALDYIKMLCQS